MLVLIVIYFLGLATWWYVRKLMAQRETQRRQDAEAAFQRRIQRDPNNTAAYEGLADSYREGKRWTDALTAYEKALETAGDESGVGAINYKIRQIQMDLDAAERRKQRQPGTRAPIKSKDLLNCVFCGASNPVARRVCEECGKELLHDSIFTALETIWTDEAQRKKMLEATAVITIPVLCIAFATNLSLEVKGVLIISTIAVGGWVFLNAFSGDIH